MNETMIITISLQVSLYQWLKDKMFEMGIKGERWRSYAINHWLNYAKNLNESQVKKG